MEYVHLFSALIFAIFLVYFFTDGDNKWEEATRKSLRNELIFTSSDNVNG